LTSDGSVVSTAEGYADAFTVAGAISIRGLHVLAEARRGSDGSLATRQDLSASGVEVGGQTFGFADGTFVLPGGAKVPVPADVVFGLMKNAGVTARFQQPVHTKSGIVSANLSLEYTVPATPGSRPVTVTVTLGRASAEVLAAALPGGPTTASVSPVSNPPAPPSQGGGGSASGPPAATTPQVALPGSVSGNGGTNASPAIAGAPTTGQPALAAVRRPITHKLSNIYLAIVAASLFTFGTATAIRTLGVRLIWTS
jgi:hypothetical protein